MDDRDALAERFDAERPRLRAVAYRMLGSIAEAEDAVQESWLRLSRSDTAGIENLSAWLTTVVGRVCLTMLRARRTRGEQPLDTHVPDPVVTAEARTDPEEEAVLADSVGLAMLVVLDALAPAERLAFVLHDLFGVPFEEIAPMIDRTPVAARQLASRARRRVRGQAPEPDRDVRRQREVVDAFFAAARDGDFDQLVGLLHPDVVLRADGGRTRQAYSAAVVGAAEVAQRALAFTRFVPFARRALVNGSAGVVAVADRRVLSVMSCTVVDGRIASIEILADPERLREIDASVLDLHV